MSKTPAVGNQYSAAEVAPRTCLFSGRVPRQCQLSIRLFCLRLRTASHSIHRSAERTSESFQKIHTRSDVPDAQTLAVIIVTVLLALPVHLCVSIVERHHEIADGELSVPLWGLRRHRRPLWVPAQGNGWRQMSLIQRPYSHDSEQQGNDEQLRRQAAATGPHLPSIESMLEAGDGLHVV